MSANIQSTTLSLEKVALRLDDAGIAWAVAFGVLGRRRLSTARLVR